MYKMIKLFVLPFLCLVFCNNLFAEKFLSISDIHFDPFLGCKAEVVPCPLAIKLQEEDYKNWEKIYKEEDHSHFSTYRQNTNFALLEASLAEIQKVQQQAHPQFMVVIGDLLGHRIKSDYAKFTGDTTTEGYDKFVKKTMQFLAEEIKHSVPNLNVYLAVGNNDSYTGDYSVVPNGKFFQETADTWKAMIKNNHNRAAFLRDFPTSGYYSILIPQTHHRMIVLNTVIFSSYIPENDSKELADQELSWLDSQLQSAEQNHEQVLLMAHVPMGIDVYLTAHSLLGQVKTFWYESYMRQFQDILSKHPALITGILSGHIHKDGFQILTLNQGTDIPITYTQSISPIYRDNPGFKVYQYDNTTFKLNNFDAYYLDLSKTDPEWGKEYNFNKSYQPDCKQCRLINGFKKILANKDQLAAYYKKYYMTGSMVDTIAAKEMNYYLCGATQYTGAGYKNCLK